MMLQIKTIMSVLMTSPYIIASITACPIENNPRNKGSLVLGRRTGPHREDSKKSMQDYRVRVTTGLDNMSKWSDMSFCG